MTHIENTHISILPTAGRSDLVPSALVPSRRALRRDLPAALITALSLAACSGGPAPHTSSSTPASASGSSASPDGPTARPSASATSGSSAAAPEAKVAWRVADMDPVTGVTLSAGKDLALYFAQRGERRYLRAISTATGKVAWQQALPKQVGWHGVTNTPPAIVGNRVAAAIAAGDDSRIRIFDVATGKQVGKDSATVNAVEDLALCADGMAWCFLGSRDGTVPMPAQRLAPGAATFTTTHAGMIRWDSAREDSLSYYVDGAKLWTFRPAAILKDCASWFCARGWATVEDTAVASLTVQARGERLHAATVAAFDAASGAQRWTSRGDVLAMPEDDHGRDVRTGDVIYVFTPDPTRMTGRYGEWDPQLLHGGSLRALDRETGAQKWRVEFERPSSFPKVIVLPGGSVIVELGNATMQVDAESGVATDAADLTYWRGTGESGNGMNTQRLLEVLEPVRDAAIAEAVPLPIPDGVGSQAGDVRVVARPDAVVAYRVG